MTSKRRKKAAQFAAITLSSLLLSGSVYAEEISTATAEEYQLGQVLVTAQRHETKDVDTPASTVILTSEQLKKTGAKNLQEALKFAPGLVYTSMGPGGTSMGTMTSKIVIRGLDGGTLVLVNGTPLNLRGLYNLEDIPVENIEQVEIVKGGGSVMYGSEATGGVINIITKKTLENSIKVAYGNFGQQNYGLNVQAGKVGISANIEKWGDVGKVSEYIASGQAKENYYRNVDRANNGFVYNFDKISSLQYSHSEAKYSYDYKFGAGYASSLIGKNQYDRNIKDNKDLVQYQYKRDNTKATVYFNQKTLRGSGTEYRSSSGSLTGYPKPAAISFNENNHTYGLDLQHDWLIEKNRISMGMTYQNEYYKPDINNTVDYERDNYSVYGQWEHPVSAADTFIISGRESWTANAPNGRNCDNFSAQGQFLHKLNKNETLYASAGQSFVMPTFKQIYGNDPNQIGNPNLKPQYGEHYELGWKKNADKHQWKLAIFNMSIKDNISANFDTSTGIYKYDNADFKNTGVELACTIDTGKDWNFNWGATYSDPLTKSTDKPYWDRANGRVQLNGGATYKHDRWQAAVSCNYLADRVMAPSKTRSYSVRPYLLTSLNVNYTLDKKSDIFLTVNNILDRDDIISNSSALYYYTPINYTIGYKSRF